jgi:hypothetical protein
VPVDGGGAASGPWAKEWLADTITTAQAAINVIERMVAPSAFSSRQRIISHVRGDFNGIALRDSAFQDLHRSERITLAP